MNNVIIDSVKINNVNLNNICNYMNKTIINAVEICTMQRNGFYVECGAFTGELLSNSLFFETQREWQGILIEPDDKNYAKLLKKNRKAFAAHACLSDINVTKNVSISMPSLSSKHPKITNYL